MIRRKKDVTPLFYGLCCVWQTIAPKLSKNAICSACWRVGWALLPVENTDGQECPSYYCQPRATANVASVSRPKVLFLRAFGSMHGGPEAIATPAEVSFSNDPVVYSRGRRKPETSFVNSEGKRT